MSRPVQEMQAEIDALRAAIVSYIREIDNPVPDLSYRRILRNKMRKLVGEPEPAARTSR